MLGDLLDPLHVPMAAAQEKRQPGLGDQAAGLLGVGGPAFRFRQDEPHQAQQLGGPQAQDELFPAFLSAVRREGSGRGRDLKGRISSEDRNGSNGDSAQIKASHRIRSRSFKSRVYAKKHPN